ncbi:MAG: hypothetical protein ACRD1G_09665 [Acidimicrobiales bacterium]
MAIDHTIHHQSGLTAATSSRKRTCRQRPVLLHAARFVELDDIHEEAALGAWADLLAPYLEQPATNEAGS